MENQKLKNYIRKTLRTQRKAFSWLKRHGHMAFRDKPKKTRKKHRKNYEQPIIRHYRDRLAEQQISEITRDGFNLSLARLIEKYH